MIYGDTVLKVLVDRGDIRNTYEGAINPASINLRLGDSFKMIDYHKYMNNNTVFVTKHIALGEEVAYTDFTGYKHEDGSILLEHGDFILATTKEWIRVPIGAAAFVQGRSSIGRIGLSVQNAGFVDPGFEGHITLELKNDSGLPIKLIPGYPVAQLVYMEALDVSRPYKGKYVGQIEATGSRMFLDTLTPGHQVEVNAE